MVKPLPEQWHILPCRLETSPVKRHNSQTNLVELSRYGRQTPWMVVYQYFFSQDARDIEIYMEISSFR